MFTTNQARVGSFLRLLALLAALTTAAVVPALAASASASASARGRSALTPLFHLKAMAAASVPVSPPAPANGEILGGLTSQGWPVIMDIAKNGRSIAPITLGVDMTCTSGDSFSIPDGFFHVPIATNGTVHGTSTIAPFPGSTVSLTGGSRSLVGRLNRKRATFSGVWQLTLSFSMSSGQTDQCTSGRVRVRARL